MHQECCVLQAALDALGGDFESAARASPVLWAQLAASAYAGCSNPCIPLTVVHALDWHELATKLPGELCLSSDDLLVQD